MPHEYISTNAPLSAVGSAARRTGANEDYSEAIIQTAGADYDKPKFRVVASGPSVVANDNDPIIVRPRDSDSDDWPEDRPEDGPEEGPKAGPEGWLDSAMAFDARLEARMDDGHGGSQAQFVRAVDAAVGGSKTREKKRKPIRGRGVRKKANTTIPD